MENGIYEGLEEEKEGKKCKYSIISGKRWSSNLNMIVWSTTYKQKYMATFSFLRHLRKYYDFFFNKKENSHSCCICMSAVIYTNTQHTPRIPLNTP